MWTVQIISILIAFPVAFAKVILHRSSVLFRYASSASVIGIFVELLNLF
jgi:hypothetical protein